MPLDNANYISQLNTANPVGNVDTVSMLDDFIREVKKVLIQSFPNINGQTTITSAELNALKAQMVWQNGVWSVQNAGIINVAATDNDSGVQPRTYNDWRYNRRDQNLGDVPDKSAAVNNLMTGLAGNSAGYANMRNLVANMVYPVGTIYYNSIQGNNPRDFFGVGTWIAWSQGRVIIGVGQTGDTRGEVRGFNNQNQGGEFQHTLSEAEMPSHNHGNGLRMPANGRAGQVVGDYGGATGGQAWSLGSQSYNMPQSATTYTGGNQAHNNMMPYTTAFCWIRTA